jgi:hypothetical protein
LIVPIRDGFAAAPEPVSGRLVFDEVADGLNRYRRKSNEANRAQWLWKLGSARRQTNHADASELDPRVIVLLGEALYKEATMEQFAAIWLLAPFCTNPSCGPSVRTAKGWWLKYEMDVRCRAKQLP